MATRSKPVGRLVREEFGVNPENVAAYGEWVCRRWPMDGREVINGFAVWDTIVQSYMRWTINS